MFKNTPNPPNPDNHVSRSQSANAKKLDEAATRALDYYLKPPADKETSDTLDTLFIIAPNIDAECLLANLSETLASANAMVSDLAFDLEGSRRHIALGVQQMIELGQLLANRALDVVEPR
ncbi:DUF6124 family protein [Pseudomonas fluorescens]|uniref:DUF3077 domain-containing protein n=1 Tax=Pseudomonas fluorescens TaxID=294 RepID=A0A944HES8_PSEFL|nr:DUF6124 family protein [Pseudomonas fluorescens]MBT2295454.1 hypothetical protein [Pseudomonas fluorescens]MBT2308866.1 hypothetical protein [Pseudomonas fluorescens]MBT2312381.1 hypothetical protein [Pseudomonas fluorescens]MBT2318052.1 hypothetical protein [Pseudomonas fluorescens]MBT2330942.1 hypothetical protein [Pseudomonas fluorescens]